MYSTLIEQECIDELADAVGLKEKVSSITERAMNGELDFESALRERVALLKGLPESELERVYKEKITLMPGARDLVATMRKHGAYCLIVSGGFTFFTSRVRMALGFDADRSNKLLAENGQLIGKVEEPILGKEAKLAALEETCAERGINLADALAVGDGANDLPMLMAAGSGVAYHAKPVVEAQAQIAIRHCDLSALLFLQGYSRDQWAG